MQLCYSSAGSCYGLEATSGRPSTARPSSDLLVATQSATQTNDALRRKRVQHSMGKAVRSLVSVALLVALATSCSSPTRPPPFVFTGPAAEPVDLVAPLKWDPPKLAIVELAYGLLFQPPADSYLASFAEEAVARTEYMSLAMLRRDDQWRDVLELAGTHVEALELHIDELEVGATPWWVWTAGGGALGAAAAVLIGVAQ